MDKPIKIGNGILEQIKHPHYITGTITRKGLFKDMMKLYEDFYKVPLTYTTPPEKMPN